MESQYRWALLEHIGAPDDPVGIHYDLLLEDKHVCRAWRLSQIPILDAPFQKVVSLPAHRLEWLEIGEIEVSGGRGWARLVFSGVFWGDLPKSEADLVHIRLNSSGIKGYLEIKNCLCRICSTSDSGLY